MSATPPVSAGDTLVIGAPAEWREVCFSLPAVRALAGMGAKVSIAAPELQRDFWVAAGFPDGLFFPTGAAARKISPLMEKTERLLVWEPGEIATAGRRAKVPTRIGPRDDRLGQDLTHPAGPRPRPGPPEHRVSHYLKLVEDLGTDPYVAAHFASLGLATADAAPILLLPDSDFGANHEWPLDLWVRLAARLAEMGETVAIGGPVDSATQLGTRLGEALELPVATFDLPALDQLAAHERCLGADSSMIHLAGATGATCAVLFGPGDPRLHRPLGRRHRIIRREVECSPCFSSRCALDLRCQHDLSVEYVLAQLKTVGPA